MGFTGVVLVASFAMFKLLMAMFNAGIILPPLFCRWDVSVMVETQCGRERAVRCGCCGKEPRPYKDGRPPCYRASCRWSHSVKGVIEFTAVAFEDEREVD